MPAPQQRDPLVPRGTSTALVIPPDVQADLLRSQAESIGTPQRLPRIKIMPAAAGLFEFTDDSSTTREFSGIILGSHARNVLWDGAFGEERAEADRAPACSSRDGKIGVPRAGFRHAALNDAEAIGTEQIECAACPYNAFGSKRLITENGNPKGKAVTNQRSVYVAIEGRRSPMELLVVNTSIPPFDEYLNSLLQREIPVQSVVTIFKQELKNRVGSAGRYAVATFANGGPVNAETFNRILALRTEYLHFIRPQDAVATQETIDDLSDTGETLVNGTDDDLPF
jgi:hypothetical protein